MAFDPGSGRMVLVPWSLGSGTAWTFDVCTNTFARLPLPLPQGSTEGPRELVQSGTPGVTVGFWLDGAVWTLDAGASRWDEAGGWTTALDPQAVYRQASDLVIVRDATTSEMWRYDHRAGSAELIDQGSEVPPAVTERRDGGLDSYPQLLTYDAGVDRLVLYVGDSCLGCPTPDHHTWEFDFASGSWTAQPVTAPDVNVGWEQTGNEFAYDAAHEVSMLFSDGMAAVYDAAETSWRTLLGDPTGRRLGTGPLHRLGFAMAYDPVNERFVITGGQFRRKSTTWVVAVDVWAIDGAGGEPLELVPQSRSAPARAGT